MYTTHRLKCASIDPFSHSVAAPRLNGTAYLPRRDQPADDVGCASDLFSAKVKAKGQEVSSNYAHETFG